MFLIHFSRLVACVVVPASRGSTGKFNLGLQQYKQDSRKNEGSTHGLGPLQNERCNVPFNIAEHAELQQLEASLSIASSGSDIAVHTICIRMMEHRSQGLFNFSLP